MLPRRESPFQEFTDGDCGNRRYRFGTRYSSVRGTSVQIDSLGRVRHRLGDHELHVISIKTGGHADFCDSVGYINRRESAYGGPAGELRGAALKAAESILRGKPIQFAAQVGGVGPKAQERVAVH
jgi:hypothetical protein